MSRTCAAAILLSFLELIGPARAQGPALPNEGEPLLRLEAGGPSSDVTALAFSPDGRTLYAAGFDKVVRTWKWDAIAGEFVPQRTSYRVPIGPGMAGAINAIALSADGQWLAVGGVGAFQGQAGFAAPGLWVPAGALTPAMQQDRGTIYLFHTTKATEARALRGHRGAVLALAFVEQDQDLPPLLVSAAEHWADKATQPTGMVYLWDAAKGKQLAELPGLPNPAGSRRPGLAAWRSGKGALQVHVAIAWEDGTYEQPGTARVWDVARKVVRTSPEGRFNNTAVHLPGQAKVLTGSWLRSTSDGRLQAWELGPNDTLAAGASPAGFSHANGTVLFPRALVLVSKEGDGGLDHAAVVLRVQPGNEYRLLLAPLAESFAYQIDDAVPLWKGGRLPVLAAAPRGRFLAVAGAGDHAIRVFAVADLLKNKAAPLQLLRSIGERVVYAGFASKGQGKDRRLGLVLGDRLKPARGGPPRPPAAEDMIFDFAGRGLTSKTDGWTIDAPNLDGWSHDAVAAPAEGQPRPPHMRILSPDGAETLVKLADDQVITEHALLPPQPPLKTPLLAVASHGSAGPELSLRNATSGEHVCQLSGHTSNISSLAFTADGRFLVSAADDQTVCLWTLANLNNFLGKQGQLRGVLVQKGDNAGELVVTRVDPESPAAKTLHKGDVLTGLILGNKTQPLTTAPEFYNAILTQVPGSKLTLRRGDGEKVQVPVSQAVQERTPLVVLFVTRGGKAEEREWLGWNPLGPYDSSTPKAARSFAWHVNTGKAAEPVQIIPAEADKERAKQRREGLLEHLVKRGSLAPALDDWEKARKPLPPPKMTLEVDEMPKHLVRQSTAALRLRVDGIDSDKVKSVQWQIVGDKTWQDFAKASAEGLGADYEQPMAWKRGPQTVRARLQTREKVSQEFFARELAVVYRPPPPALELLGSGKSLVMEKEEFTLQAKVVPGLPDEAVVIQLYHPQGGPNPRVLPGQGEIKVPVKLHLGPNRLEVVVFHKDGLPDPELLETRRLSVDVTYRLPKVIPPPVITMTVQKIMPLLGGIQPGETLEPPPPGRAIVVTVPRVRLVGKIVANRNVAEAKMAMDKEAPRNLANFMPDKAKEFSIAEDLTLKPGRQTVSLSARTAADPVAPAAKATEMLLLEYVPALPRAELAVDPAGPAFEDKGQGPPNVVFGGALVSPADPAPPDVKITATVLLNGTEFPAKVDEKAGTWTTAPLGLPPGRTRVKVKLKNDWQQAEFGDLQLTYLLLPHNLRATLPTESKGKMVRLDAEVDSSLPLVPESFKVILNGQQVGPPKLVPPAAKDSPTWKASLELNLQVGENDVAVAVHNADGPCRELFRRKVIVAPPVVVPPPRVTFLEPQGTPTADGQGAVKVKRPKLDVTIRIQSPVPPGRLTLVVRSDDGEAERRPVDLAAMKPIDGGFAVRAVVPLLVGLSRLTAEVETPNGRGSTPDLLVIRLQPPPQVVLETVGGREPGDVPVRIVEGKDGTFAAPAATKAPLRLRGKVVWEHPGPEQLRAPQLVAVYVNGAQQCRERLELPGAGTRERTFTGDILLNRSTGNLIEVELPGVADAAASFRVDCTEPLPARWLHVQIISPDEPNEKALVGQVLKTLQGSGYDRAKGAFTTKGFAEGRLYAPLAEDVDEDNVVQALGKIKRAIRLRAAAGWPNDVVLLYFVGGEVTAKAGGAFALTAGRARRPLIDRHRLEEMFADMLGVKILVLDVAQGEPAKRPVGPKVQQELARWLEEPGRHAWLRVAWLGEGSMPADARLLTVMGKAMPEGDNLGRVVARMEALFRGLSQRYTTLERELRVPPSLADLNLGKEP